MSKTVSFSILGVILLLIGYLCASPYIAVYQIKNAFAQGDVDKVSAYLDIPSVKDSLREPFFYYVSGRIKAKHQDKLSGDGIQRQITERQIANKILDDWFSPVGIKEMIQDYSPEPGTQPLDYSMGYLSFNRFAVLLKFEGEKSIHVLVSMHREGLSWSVKAIKLIENQ